MHASTNIRFIPAADVHAILTYPACIGVVRKAMVETSRRNVELPLRHGMRLPGGKGMLGMMYGYLGEPAGFGIKLVSLFPGNSAAGLSSHMGLFILYEPEHGKPVAIMDGSAITAVRTAAASAVATDALARPDARVLAILGTGEQAGSHLRAMATVRELTEVRVWGRDPRKAAAFVEHHAGDVKARLLPAATVDDAVRDADIICTVTAASTPILFGRQVIAGMHINLVGSSFPDKAEVDSELVLKSRYYVDYRDSTLAQAGEFIQAKAVGLIEDSHIVAEIGAVLDGKAPGRADGAEITVYKSLGIAAQDLAAGDYVWREAERKGTGQLLTL